MKFVELSVDFLFKPVTWIHVFSFLLGIGVIRLIGYILSKIFDKK